MTYVEEIVNAFESLGGIAHYNELYDYIEKHTDRNLPKNWKAIVRARIEERSSDSTQFLNRDDLFQAVDGLGNGVWKLRHFESKSQISNDIEEEAIPGKKDVIVTRVIRDNKKTKDLKMLYRYRCQVCGIVLLLPFGNYAEGHHIKPLGNKHNGSDSENNLLILCPNHHAEFDYGAIAIDPQTEEIIHFDEKNPYHGKKLIVNPHHKINRDFLKYHLDKIFNK